MKLQWSSAGRSRFGWLDFTRYSFPLLGALILEPGANLHAGGIVTNCTEAALRAAMTGGGTVTFACDGTIVLGATITNTQDTTIDALGHLVKVSGGDSVRVFYVSTNVSFSVKNLLIGHGRSTNGAGIFNEGGLVTLEGVTLVGNFATNALPAHEGNARGGGIWNQGGTVSATNCVFAANGANQGATAIPSLGGALFNANGTATLWNCVFAGNAAGNAARAAASYGDPVVGGNSSGGAIYNAGFLLVDRCSFLGNWAEGGAGASFYNGVPYTSYNGGSGGEAGGGALCNVGIVRMQQCLLASNSVTGGAGGRGSDAWAGVGWPWTRPGGSGGAGASGNGGAILNLGTADLANCTVYGNQAIGGTGGQGGNSASFWWEGHLYYAPGGAPGSTGAGFGGIYTSNAVMNVTNCTIAFNSGAPGWVSSLAASGIYAGAPAASNSACHLVNTVLAFNSNTNYSGGCADGGHNISSDGSCQFTNAGSSNNLDPILDLLANNGGATLTSALRPGSPAIDAGNTASSLPIDQRGFARPVGLAADIGAFEYDAPLRFKQIAGAAGVINMLVVGGASGQPCRLLASDCLANWQPMASNQFNEQGMILFSNSPTKVVEFYRAVSP